MYYITKKKMSIYNLKTSQNELSSANDGTTRLEYEQLAPTRDVTKAAFPKGVIRWQWQNSGQRWWIPSRSYMRVRSRLTKTGGAILNVADDVAPNMNLCANLFQSGDFKIANKTISSISAYMPQVDALDKRTSKPATWLNGVGKASNWWGEDQLARKQDVCVDGALVALGQTSVDAQSSAVLGYDVTATLEVKDNSIEIVKGGNAPDPDLPVGVFQVGDVLRLDNGVGGLTQYIVRVVAQDTVNITELTIDIGATPRAAAAGDPFSRLRSVFEDASRNKARQVKEFEMTWQPPFSIFKVDHAMPAGKYELTLNPATVAEYKKKAIESLVSDKDPSADFDFEIVDMYLYICSVEGPRADNKTYLLDLDEIRCQSHKVTSASSQTPFDVSPSTYALTTTFQDDRAGTNTMYSASKFKVDGQNSVELSLNKFFVNFASLNKPSPDADPAFDVEIDNTMQRYVETQIQTMRYWEEGGAESLREFQDRGQYFYQSWPRDSTDRSTRVNIHYGFKANPANTNLLLFDHYKQVAQIQIQDGQVVSVMLEQQ